ncbi:MAG: hypothetical protein HY721_16310 [Planctomycetes bacterium]|nr:hypothetical protein [Planctomycetota bacterium]
MIVEARRNDGRDPIGVANVAGGWPPGAWLLVVPLPSGARRIVIDDELFKALFAEAAEEARP